ncbi:ROK family protein [Pseudonocardia sp. MH-G8]|uniref:ROK family protein n=1 Tax=Pseudonocardia sp. MH-G8 TaxID=1854588 RepID=UPI000BA1081A|nr:ROK family protein [Pseudonocardia sp. MH-G8]OZM84007.1 ROK family protein [Pseudonocardia sp. MH-G8]
MTAVPVLEIGGTHVSAALLAPPWVAERVHRSPLRADGTSAQIVEDLRRSAAVLGPQPGARWGVAIPGPFDYTAGIGRFTGVGKFDSLRGFALGDVLTRELDAAGIVFVNDAHAFGVGEWRAGTTRGHDRVLVLTLGTGVGSCFLDRGIPVESGPDVPPEGRADLLTIDGAPLEDTVSRRALLARAGDAPDVDVRHLAERALAGDAAAQVLFTDAFTALGHALAPWVRRFGASLVVVGGAVAASWDLVAAPLRAGLSGGRVDLPVVPASSAHAGLVGAAWWAHRSGGGTT